MNLEQVVQLYGTRFFITERKEKKIKSDSEGKDPLSEDKKGNVDWKIRSTSSFTFIISENEIKVTELTDVLKKMLDFCGISGEKISFGIYSYNIERNELKEMPTTIGLFFGNTPALPGRDTYEIITNSGEKKKIFMMPFLSQFKSDKVAKLTAVDVLKGIIQ